MTKKKPSRSYGSAIMTTGERENLTYKKIKDQDGMTGWLARKLAFVAFPIFWWIRFQWLSQLSFINRRIQTLNGSPQRFSLNLNTYFADSLPGKLDNVIHAIGGLFGTKYVEKSPNDDMSWD